MSFLLRAALVIGALSYLAMLRGAPGTHTGDAPTGIAGLASAMGDALPAGLKAAPAPNPPGPAASPGGLAAAWSAVPSDARQRLAREAVAEIGRRTAAAVASRDTLAETDRRAPWRGAEPR